MGRAYLAAPETDDSTMSKRTPPASLEHDRRYDRLEEMTRRIDQLRDNTKWYYPEKYPEVRKLKEDYEELYAELYPRDFFDTVVEETERDEHAMDRIESLLETRQDLRDLFQGGTRDARAIELEKNQDLRGKILAELEKDEETEDA